MLKRRVAVGQERENATSVDTEGCASIELAPALGLEPRSVESPNAAETSQNSAKLLQCSELATSTSSRDQQKPADPKQPSGTSAHPKSVPSVSTDPGLAEVIEGWDQLSFEAKARILKTVRASR